MVATIATRVATAVIQSRWRVFSVARLEPWSLSRGRVNTSRVAFTNATDVSMSCFSRARSNLPKTSSVNRVSTQCACPSLSSAPVATGARTVFTASAPNVGRAFSAATPAGHASAADPKSVAAAARTCSRAVPSFARCASARNSTSRMSAWLWQGNT